MNHRPLLALLVAAPLGCLALSPALRPELKPELRPELRSELRPAAHPAPTASLGSESDPIRADVSPAARAVPQGDGPLEGPRAPDRLDQR